MNRLNFNPPLYRRLLRKSLYLTVPLWSDKRFLQLYYYANHGYWPDFDHPKTFSEKINWLKMNRKDDRYTQLVDKVAVKAYVAGQIGEDYVIPTLAVYDNVDKIDFSKLPDQFVLKCTHDSGGIVICKDKKTLDVTRAKAKLRNALKANFVQRTKEYPYKGVTPRIIAEPYMEEEDGKGLTDYKIFCFHGEPKFLFVATGRQKGHLCFDFFDTEFNHLDCYNGHPHSDTLPTKPQGFEKMLEVAKSLSGGGNFPFVRIDLYNIKGKIYFGEFTFFHNSGMVPILPKRFEYLFGDYLRL